jgi:hypothetical protein
LNLPRVRTSLPWGRLHMFQGKLHMPQDRCKRPVNPIFPGAGRISDDLRQEVIDGAEAGS